MGTTLERNYRLRKKRRNQNMMFALLSLILIGCTSACEERLLKTIATRRRLPTVVYREGFATDAEYQAACKRFPREREELIDLVEATAFASGVSGILIFLGIVIQNPISVPIFFGFAAVIFALGICGIYRIRKTGKC